MAWKQATTNLVVNPSFEKDAVGATTITGWTNYTYTSGVAATGTRTIVDTQKLYGAKALELVKTGGSAPSRWGVYTSINVTTGITYTFSAWVKVTAISGASKQIAIYASTPGAATIMRRADTCDWTRISTTATPTATGSGSFYIWIDDADTATVYVDGAQVETTSSPTNYCDGSLSAEHAWSGTAHNSTSSRTAGNRLRLGNITDGALTGLLWDGARLTWTAANTALDAAGNLTATSATLSGAITATSGAIAGDLSIGTGGKLYSGAAATWQSDGYQLEYNAGDPRSLHRRRRRHRQ